MANAGSGHATGRIEFQLAPPSAATRLWLWLLAGVLPAAAAAALFGYLAASGRMAAASALAGFAAMVLPALAVGAVVARQMHGHRLVLLADGLGLATGAHRQRLSLPELELERARVLDLDEHLEFKPRLKTNGTFLPGFQAGWYRLRNGSRALVARAGGRKVLWIPTTRGFGLLLQPRLPPRELLQRLREAAAAGDGAGAAPAPPAGPRKTYWFPAKQYGWGWGAPCAWQGWVVLGLFIGGGLVLPLFVSGGRQLFACLAVMTGLVIVICIFKGEPPRWRWGGDDGF